jgi:adenosylmethionine-8-amino-7-oxononanoate aminotransferase
VTDRSGATRYPTVCDDVVMSTVSEPTSVDRYPFTRVANRPPLVVATEGSELILDDGRRILDAAGGAVVTNIGHGRHEVADAVSAAMRSIDYVVPTWATPNRVALVERLADRWLPDGFDHVYFAGGGSEATDTAVRVARSYHLARGDEGRYKVLARVPSYHGATVTTLAIGGHMARRSGLDPLLAEWPKVPWNDAGALASAIEAAGPDTVAAFMAEPVIGASAGALVADDDYWQQIMEICEHYGILLIADEVMTGFGRTGLTWGHQHDPVRPDVLVSAKGLGGGYVPMSMVSASNHVLDTISDAGGSVMFFTYSGPDAMCAGALAVLDIMERENLVERAASMGERLQSSLRSALDGHRRVTEVRGRGLMIGAELSGVTAAAAVDACVERGMWVYPAGSGPAVADALLFAPPLTVSEDEIDRIVAITVDALDSL